MEQIRCEKISIGYSGKTIVEDLNFGIEKGQYLCIIGKNGSGKTLLMKTLLGLLPPLKGEIIKDSNLKTNEIGYLPQMTEIQRDFPASVWEIVLSGFQSKARLRPFYNKLEKTKAKENLKKMGIENLKDKCFRELSGGQKQRVLLARALSAGDKILFLDEPVTGLDPKAIGEFYKLIKELNKEGLTIVMISHDINEGLKDATHILELGNKVYHEKKENFLKKYKEGEKDA